jgi:hypothetical protein
LVELVLTLNNVSFDGEHYQQIRGVAMGTKMGPNYAIFFLVLWKNRSSNNTLNMTDPILDYLGRYILAWMITVFAQHHWKSFQNPYHGNSMNLRWK